ncbi:MAG: hypothetical protein C4309_05480 [Chloroflexota bacterium]
MKPQAQPVYPAEGATRLAWVDSIKGLAILGILLYHVVILIFDIPPFDHPKDDWLPLAERIARLQPRPHETLAISLLANVLRYLGWLGYQGVHLFLVLSGFTLAYSLARRLPTADTNWRQFFQRRLWRLLPLYWAGHFFFLVFQALVGQLVAQPKISLLDSRFHLSLVGVRFLPTTFAYISPAWWYFGLIVQLHLVFPLLWIWLQRKGLLHFWIATATITLVSRFIALIIVGNQREMWSMGALFATRLFEFTFGMGLAYWLVHRPESLKHLWQKRWPLVAAGLAYLLALALSFTVVGSIVAHSLIAVSLFGISHAFSQYSLSSVKLLEQIIGRMVRQTVLWANDLASTPPVVVYCVGQRPSTWSALLGPARPLSALDRAGISGLQRNRRTY